MAASSPGPSATKSKLDCQESPEQSGSFPSLLVSMGDAARPSEDEFGRVLQESLKIWSTYLDARSEDRLLPRHAIDLRPVVSRTPPFLGGGLAGMDKTASFDSEEKKSSQSQGSLFVNGRSTWRTSKGGCDLQPRIMPKQLLLGVGIPTNVTLSEDSHFSDWPGA